MKLVGKTNHGKLNSQISKLSILTCQSKKKQSQKDYIKINFKMNIFLEKIFLTQKSNNFKLKIYKF